MPNLARKRFPLVKGVPGATAISLKLRCSLMVVQGISMPRLSRSDISRKRVSIRTDFFPGLDGKVGGQAFSCTLQIESANLSGEIHEGSK